MSVRVSSSCFWLVIIRYDGRRVKVQADEGRSADAKITDDDGSFYSYQGMKSEVIARMLGAVG